jgi:hypothetical protein
VIISMADARIIPGRITLARIIPALVWNIFVRIVAARIIPALRLILI